MPNAVPNVHTGLAYYNQISTRLSQWRKCPPAANGNCRAIRWPQSSLLCAFHFSSVRLQSRSLWYDCLSITRLVRREQTRVREKKMNNWVTYLSDAILCLPEIGPVIALPALLYSSISTLTMLTSLVSHYLSSGYTLTSTSRVFYSHCLDTTAHRP